MKQSALHFAKRHSPSFGCATVFLTERIELDLCNQGSQLAAFLSTVKRTVVGLVLEALQNLRNATERDTIHGCGKQAPKNVNNLPRVT